MTSCVGVNAKVLLTQRENAQCLVATGHLYVNVIARWYEIRNAYHKGAFHSYDGPKFTEPLGVHRAGAIAKD